MPNPNPADEKKAAEQKPEEQKPEEKKDYLKSIRGDISSITRSAGVDNKNAADPYHTRDAYLGTLQTKFGAVADEVLAKEIKSGSLSEDTLKQKMEIKSPQANADLEAKWGAAQTALLADAKAGLETMKTDASREIRKLFNRPEPPAGAPPAFDEKEWKKAFDDRIVAFEQKIEAKKTQLEGEMKDIIANGHGGGPPPVPLTDIEQKQIRDQGAEQLKKLDELKAHYKSELEKQRDTAVYKAMSETKIQSDQKVAQGMSAGDALNINQNLTLAEHAERLRIAKLRFIYKLEEGKIWDTQELFDFEKHELSPGTYSAYIQTDPSMSFMSKLGFNVTEDKFTYRLKFAITEEGIVFKQGRGGATSDHYDKMVEVFYAIKKNREYETEGPLQGALKGKISIEKHVTMESLEKLATSIQSRRDPASGKDPVSLELDDDSVKALLKQTRWNLLTEGRWSPTNKNKPEDVAKLIVRLQGLNPNDGPDYEKALKAAEERVVKMGAAVRKDKVDQQQATQPTQQSSSPAAKAKPN